MISIIIIITRLEYLIIDVELKPRFLDKYLQML